MSEKGRRPRVLVFASGDAEGGGSGFQEMVEYSRTSPAILDADIVGVVTNHENGGVFKRAMRLGIDCAYSFGVPSDAEFYQNMVKEFNADFVMLSGWLKLVKGLDPARTINIHPGPLPGFGGPGMYGHHVHEAVIEAYKRGEIAQSAATMHFVTEIFDDGPIIHEAPVLMRDDDTSDTIATRVNEAERVLQSRILNLVVNGNIFYHEGKVMRRDDNLKNEWYL